MSRQHDTTGPGGEMVTVLETADLGLLAVAKSLLHGARIPHLVQGEEALGLLPLGRLGGPFVRRGLGAAILVPIEHAEEARTLLAAEPE